jgi:hypothetical protein
MPLKYRLNTAILLPAKAYAAYATILSLIELDLNTEHAQSSPECVYTRYYHQNLPYHDLRGQPPRLAYRRSARLAVAVPTTSTFDTATLPLFHFAFREDGILHPRTMPRYKFFGPAPLRISSLTKLTLPINRRPKLDDR